METASFDFDVTKLSVHEGYRPGGNRGFYDLLRDEYDIQIEFGDLGNILAYLSIGDKTEGGGTAHKRPLGDTAPVQPR